MAKIFSSFLYPQKEEPRCSGGIDFGAAGTILVIGPKGRRLVWRKGSYHWASRLHPHVYDPSHLQVVGGNMDYSMGHTIFKGGRLSKARFTKKVMKEIRKLLGIPPEFKPLTVPSDATLILGTSMMYPV